MIAVRRVRGTIDQVGEGSTTGEMRDGDEDGRGGARERGAVVDPFRQRAPSGDVLASLAAVLAWQRTARATLADALGGSDPLSVARDLRRAHGACRLDEIDDALAAVERLRPELLELRRVLGTLARWKRPMA